MRYSSEGFLRYDPGPNTRIVLLVDQGLADYYRRLIPRHIEVKPQRHAAHITVFRTGLEHTDSPAWGRHDGEIVPFTYDGQIFHHDGYFYLEVESERLDAIRRELWLPRHFDPVKGHHITIGNDR